MPCCLEGVRLWLVVGLLIGAAAAAVAAYFLPERDTAITRDVLAEEIRRSMADFGPLVNDFRK
jgi:gas vesicle protein